MAVKKTSSKLRAQRDAKAMPHLQQYAPVWLEKEQILADKDAILFNVVFQHPRYGWVSRRYRYDAFNDVLYHKGQRVLGEAEAWAIQENAPYVEALQTDIPNSYGG